MFKRFMNKGFFLVLAALLLVGGEVSKVRAAGVELAVIGPHEYALPVNFESFNAVVEYGFWNDNSEGTGTVADSDTDTYLGIAKYVRFFCLDSVPDVGFVFEVLQPHAATVGKGDTTSGFGDTILGPAVWFKPSENSTLGAQSFLQVPIGDEELSNHRFRNLTSIFWDWQLGKFNIDGDAGFIVSSDYENGGVTSEIGTVYHANLRLAYRLTTMFEPLLAFDWNAGDSGKVKTGPDEGDAIPSFDETTMGIGAMIHFSPNISLTARYDRAIDARNVTKTDAVYFKFAYIW